VPSYCSDNNQSQDCSGCAGKSTCITTPSFTGKSGALGPSGTWPLVTSVGSSEPFAFSRSTHFGLTSGGACGFGLYALCSSAISNSDCTAFCLAYPNLCKDPTSGNTFRGNFAAPNGDYYTQWRPDAPQTGWQSRDNHLSCGECFELIKTKADGTDYATGDVGYTAPVSLEIVDSCPCDANSKWCCGSGYDHCGEVSNFKYGCPLPAGSHHMDLSDYAFGRLDTGSPTSILGGVIPTRYRRIPCPTLGNMYAWLRNGGGPYYFALTIVNTAGIGNILTVEIQGSGTTTWTFLVTDPNYTSSRPQERYGAYTVPQNTGPYNLPISLRITSGALETVVATNIITSFAAPASLDPNFYYLDLGVQFL